MRASLVGQTLIAVALLAGVACSSAPLSGRGFPAAVRDDGSGPPSALRVTLPASGLSEDQQVTHALNRLGYGPRSGDVERVRQMGLARWIERQLEPGRIRDDAMEAALQAFPTLTMSVPELVRAYPEPGQQALAHLQAGQMSQEEMRAIVPVEKRPVRIAAELQAAKLTRAVLSERQLEEVMTDFWFNHFNVDARKGAVKWMIADYERTAIRPHALGNFRDLLRATARHPAMLFYLDNWMSTRIGFVPSAGPARGRTLGLNENYAREILELHTLGVDGGFTQEDVIDVARAFTGWSIDRPRESGTFRFVPVAHDNGAKQVLGHVLPANGGEQDGLTIIDILSSHPSTARFIATKLARRFVSDEPPPALVERAARAFQDSGGDIRTVLVTIIASPEFFSAEAYRAKMKTPLELVTSSVRAVEGEIEAPGSQSFGGGLVLARLVNKLGQPLYQQQPPTGYPDVAEAWVNSGALLSRMNFALALTANRVPGVRVHLSGVGGSVDRRRPADVLDALLRWVLQGQVTAQTRRVLAAQIDDPEIARATRDDQGPADTDVEKLAALVLGSPEFQRR